jgi:OPT family oligopeptide transporter
MTRPRVYTNTLQDFEPSNIMVDGVLDVEAYKKYSPLFQGPRIALAYALSFASISCLLVHSALYDGMTILKGFRYRSWEGIHLQKMRKYREAPEWWYQVLLAVVFVISMVGIVVYPTFLPWWGFVLTMLFPIIFTIPIGVIEARTSQQIGLNVITEFLAGYLWPGKPIANTLVKIYGYMSMVKALLFVRDLKLGVYMKIPPRATFRFQIIGSLVSCLSALGILIDHLHEGSLYCRAGAMAHRLRAESLRSSKCARVHLPQLKCLLPGDSNLGGITFLHIEIDDRSLLLPVFLVRELRTAIVCGIS